MRSVKITWRSCIRNEVESLEEYSLKDCKWGSMKTLNLERETCLVVFHFFFALIVNLVKKFECAKGVTNFMAPGWGIGPQAVSWGSRSRFVVELQISIQLTPGSCVFLDSNQQQKVLKSVDLVCLHIDCLAPLWKWSDNIVTVLVRDQYESRLSRTF